MTDVSRSEITAMNERLNLHERNIAENRHDIRSGAQVFDIRLAQLSASIEELKNILKWAGGLIVTLMISFMTWSALQQYNANESQKQDLQNQIRLNESNERAEKDREAILRQLRNDLAPGGTVSTTTSDSGS